MERGIRPFRCAKAEAHYALARGEGGSIIDYAMHDEYSALAALGFLLLHFALLFRRAERERQLSDTANKSRLHNDGR